MVEADTGKQCASTITTASTAVAAVAAVTND